MIRSSLRHWLNRRAHSSHRGRRCAGPPNRRSRLYPEALEDRCLPSTVTNLDDAGAGSLRQAILDTPAGGTVDFQPGLSGTITLTTGELAIAKDLTIAGPGADVITVSGKHASRVLEIMGAGFHVALSGLTPADGQSGSSSGGGISNDGGTLTVSNSILSGNSASIGSAAGGGVANEGGTVILTNSTLSGNSAPSVAGGIDNNGGTVILTNSTLSGNSAFTGDGGGIVNNGGTVILTSSTLTGNTANLAGGGIHNDGGTLILTSSTLSGNSAGIGGGIVNNGMLTCTNSTLGGNSAGLGGAIFSIETLSMHNTLVAGNTAGEGGGIYINGGTATLLNSTLSGNTADTAGGGIDNDVGTVTFLNSTLSGNSTLYGGGIDNFGTLTLTNSTLSGNSASANGGGIYNTAQLTVTLTSSTVSGNSASANGGGIYNDGGGIITRNTLDAGNGAPNAPDLFGSLTSQGHNLIGDGTGGNGYDPTDLVGTSDNPINPKLDPLQDNGGPTPTMAPLPSSPAIDAGDPTDAPPTDQRGLPRVLDGTIDIGAVELRVFHVTSTADTGPGSLRQAILDANATPGTNGIAFSLGAGGVQTIAPTSPLPAVTNPVEIDGATEPGYAGMPRIELTGESAGPGADGLTLAGAGSTVTGLVVGGFGGAGVSISGNGNRVVGNFLGTDATGTLAHPNGTGVAVVYIGSDNTIGGTEPGAGNLISGNLQDGVGMYGGTGNQIEGNFIGTDASGTRALPNGYGVELFSGSANTISGGSLPGAGNVISGNLYDGIGIYSDGNVIQGNRIGTDLSGTNPLGNGRDGVDILAFQYGYDNLIGGTDPGAGNTIAHNGGYGVRVTTGTGEAIRQNAIFANAAGGIQLLNGANHNEPTPILTSAVSGGGITTIAGTVAGDPGQTLTVEFFDNPLRVRQGESFLGSLVVPVGADGQGSFEFQVSGGVNVGDFVTATATDAAGNTSRFSKPAEVSGTDTASGFPNGVAVFPGLATAPPATTSSADDPAATPATPSPGAGGTSPAIPSETTVPAVRLALARHALDAVFAGRDPGTDGLAPNWT
jgi:hypothetical protein